MDIFYLFFVILASDMVNQMTLVVLSLKWLSISQVPYYYYYYSYYYYYYYYYHHHHQQHGLGKPSSWQASFGWARLPAGARGWARLKWGGGQSSIQPREPFVQTHRKRTARYIQTFSVTKIPMRACVRVGSRRAHPLSLVEVAAFMEGEVALRNRQGSVPVKTILRRLAVYSPRGGQ